LVIAAWPLSAISTRILFLPFSRLRALLFSETETVYTSRELRGSWGSLAVDDAPMLQDKGKGRATVSLEGAAADGTHGKSWTLKLAPGWTTSPGERRGDRTVIRKTPAQ